MKRVEVFSFEICFLQTVKIVIFFLFFFDYELYSTNTLAKAWVLTLRLFDFIIV